MLQTYADVPELLNAWSTAMGLVSEVTTWAGNNETMAIGVGVVMAYVLFSLGWAIVRPLVSVALWLSPLRWVKLLI